MSNANFTNVRKDDFFTNANISDDLKVENIHFLGNDQATPGSNLLYSSQQINIQSILPSSAVSIALNASTPGTGGITLLSGTGNTRINSTGEIQLESSDADGVRIGAANQAGSHIISTQTAVPGATPGADFNAATVVGTDMAGTINCTKAAGGAAATVAVAFSQAYTATPKAVVVTSNDTSAAAGIYVSALSNTGFTITVTTTSAGAGATVLYYMVIA